MAEPVARIDMFRFHDGDPGVRLSADQSFMDLDPVDRCTLLAAVMHLCTMSISAICADHPDSEDEIRERVEGLSISVAPHQRVN
jgi:hypothetical protein